MATPSDTQGGGAALPPLPPGFVLDQTPGQSSIPPLPAGFTLDSQPSNLPPLPAGFTLDQPQSGPKDTSYGGALQQGVHDALGGLGSTLGVLSGDIGWKGGQKFGQEMSNAISAPANYSSASADMVDKLKQGKILGAVEELPRAAVEGAPQVLGGLGSAALGGAVGGPVGAAVGAGAY